MMMPRYLALTTLARWYSAILLAGMSFGAAPAPAPASLRALVRDYREQPSKIKLAAIARYAKAHPRDEFGALARFALGMLAYDDKDAEGAIGYLKAAQPVLPKLADYAAFYLAGAHAQLENFEAVLSVLPQTERLPVRSPLAPKLLILEARARIETGSAQAALQKLRDASADLPQPDGDLVLARAHEALNEKAAAVRCYQRVYFLYPGSEGSGEAAAALARLREEMGESYPVPESQWMLDRGDRLLAARDYSRAREEFSTLTGRLTGSHRDIARVRLGVVDYRQGANARGYHYLKTLEVGTPEADAERLYYLIECARRLDRDREMLALTQRLGELYPGSEWRKKALVAAANRMLTLNRVDDATPLYRACADSFPEDPDAPLCHWKVTWQAVIQRKREAADLLKEHLQRFPGSTKIPTVFYFLGRLAEKAGDAAAARAYYSKMVGLYGSYYYGWLGSQKLRQPTINRAGPSDPVERFLAGVSFPPRKDPGSFKPTPEDEQYFARARLLAAAGFSDLAEAELRFAAKLSGNPCLMAMEAGRLAESPHQALQAMKRFTPDYFRLDFSSAPRQFWELLFPMPFRNELIKYARQNSLDPYVVAGLIRQESEFNPKAVSRAKAYGLTQVLPSTGRQLARQEGIRRFSASMLFQPPVNLRLGTMYLKRLLDQWDGKWEPALASYNAGKSRVDEWITWNGYEDPAEFVETIPFTETREYVQAVLRNAAFYRRLYDEKTLQP